MSHPPRKGLCSSFCHPERSGPTFVSRGLRASGRAVEGPGQTVILATKNNSFAACPLAPSLAAFVFKQAQVVCGLSYLVTSDGVTSCQRRSANQGKFTFKLSRY